MRPHNCHLRLLNRFLLGFCLLVVNTLAATTNDQIGSSKDIEKLLEKGEELLSKNGHERLYQIDSVIAANLHLADSQNRIRYYLFKGGFSQKLLDFKASKGHYEKALSLTGKKDYRNLAIGHFGISMFHKHFKNPDIQETYLLKAYAFAKMAEDRFWTLHAALGLAALSDSRNEYENTKEYLSQCIAIDSSNGAVRLRRANLYFKNDRFRLGMEDLWEVVLNDPGFENQVTMYALFNVISVHIDMESYEKAREILTIVLENPEKYDKKVVGYYTFYEGVLLQKEGFDDAAKKYFLKALTIYSDKKLQENVLRCLFPIDRDNWHARYLEDFIENGLVGKGFVETALGKMIQLVLVSNEATIQGKRHAIDRAFAFMSDNQALSPSYQLWLLNRLKETNDGRLFYRKNEIQETIDSLLTVEKRNKQTIVDNYVYVNNKSFNKRIEEGKLLLNEKEDIIAQEKKTNDFITNVVLIMLVVLLVISGLLWKIFKDRDKIKKLNKVVLAKNLSLQHYGKEYEDLLMILGHQVKKPVNHLHYSFSEIIDKTRVLEDAELDLILSTVSNNTEELSNRIKIILTLIRCRIEDIAITTSKVNIYNLIKERLHFFEPYFNNANLRFNFEVDTTLCTENNSESLAIIFDNLFENIKKYGLPGNIVNLRLSQTPEGILMEIENSFSKQLQNQLLSQKIDAKKTSHSFGLGNKIIKALCDRLKIDFEFVQRNNTYATRLLFKS